MAFSFIVLLVAAYLLGSVPAAYFAARWARGIDIREYGSGNAGASNFSSVVSKWWTVPVIIFDLGKGMLVVYLAKLLGLEVYQQVLVGLAAVCGHNWPLFLNFNGGRGILTTAGVIFVLAPWLTLAMIVIALALAPFHQLPVGTLIAFLFGTFASWYLTVPFHVERSLPLFLGFLAVFLLAVFRRLVVPRTELSASLPIKDVLLNRMLFDRDIKDRKIWTKRSPAKANPVKNPMDLAGK
jgi:glycerol-3-phosphate acyltransferase PlsY